MKALLLLIVLALSANAMAATAYFTGRQEIITTVTHQVAWRCEYRYLGKTYWFVFRNSCPSNVEVY